MGLVASEAITDFRVRENCVVVDEKWRMSQELFELNASDAVEMKFDAAQIIFQPDDPADYFFIIQSGEVRLYDINGDGTPRLLDILGPEDWVGSAALAHMPLNTQRAVAVTPTVLIALPVTNLRDLLAARPNLAVRILESMARRLQQAWSDASRLVFDDCRHRLIKTLLRFSKSSAAKPEADGIVLHITHKQLAQAVGAARETVSVCLTELRLQNIVRTGRNQLHFNPRQLQELNVV